MMYDKARQSYSEDIQSPKDMSLEERIERIIHTPEVELDGNAYADNYKLNDGKSIKDFILDKLRLNDKRKNIVNAEKLAFELNRHKD